MKKEKGGKKEKVSIEKDREERKQRGKEREKGGVKSRVQEVT